MAESYNRKWNDAQQRGLSKSNSLQCVDMHCHCLPGLDDGPTNMTEAITLCEALVADGITTVIATPHQLGRFDGCYDGPEIRQRACDLNQALKKQKIPLTVLPGAEVRVDERIPQLLESDRVLTLADGGKYVLLELPYDIFIDIERLLTELVSLKIRPIISHPEKHNAPDRWPKTILKWLEIGAYIQITASSLLGSFGPEIERAACHFLCSGWTTLVATDAHDINARRPRMKATFERISTGLSEAIARLLCIENPSRVVNGQDIVPVSVRNLQELGR